MLSISRSGKSGPYEETRPFRVRNVGQLLVLAFTSLIASSAAPRSPNHLSGQTAPYLKRAVSPAR